MIDIIDIKNHSIFIIFLLTMSIIAGLYSQFRVLFQKSFFLCRPKPFSPFRLCFVIVGIKRLRRLESFLVQLQEHFRSEPRRQFQQRVSSQLPIPHVGFFRIIFLQKKTTIFCRNTDTSLRGWRQNFRIFTENQSRMNYQGIS